MLDLRGRWSIVSWIQRYDDGRITYPMGKELAGFIQYDATRVFVLIERADRPPFRSGGQWNASVEEKAGAYDSFMSYAGTYEVQGDEVLHRVEFAIFPNWQGAAQRRRVSLEGNRLMLTARLEVGTPEARAAELLWERVA